MSRSLDSRKLLLRAQRLPGLRKSRIAQRRLAACGGTTLLLSWGVGWEYMDDFCQAQAEATRGLLDALPKGRYDAIVRNDQFRLVGIKVR